MEVKGFQASMAVKNGFLHISDHELQVNVTGSAEGYCVEDQCTGLVLARNVDLHTAYRISTQYRQAH